MILSGKGPWTFSWRLNERINGMFSPEERRRAVELCFATPMTTAQVVKHLGLSDQTVPGTLAGKGFPACWPYGQTRHPIGDKNEGDRTGVGRR